MSEGLVVVYGFAKALGAAATAVMLSAYVVLFPWLDVFPVLIAC